MNNIETGIMMYSWAKDLFFMPRSITGHGTRATLNYIKKIIPNLNIASVNSGEKVFDWVVPDEWTIRDAFIENDSGKKIIDFKKNNLHVLGYSVPVDKIITLDELNDHLYSLPEQPSAVPYVTSYYERRWGFCLSHQQRLQLSNGSYRVVVDADLRPGVLNYGELLIQGTEGCLEEIFLSTYICHPSMANNELSGPVVTVALAKWLLNLKKRKYNYRIVFIPETIGSITYLSKNNIEFLKQKITAGFNITCVGDDRAYSYLPSRDGCTISDLIAKHVLRWLDPNFKRYSWSDRGSDERQYCAPGIDLPIASIMRTKYGEYPEYHTSLDNLEQVVTPGGLQGGFEAIRLALEALENNCYPKVKVLGEPQLGKRGLYPTLSAKNSGEKVKLMMDLITWSDGTKSLLDIAEKCNCPIWSLYSLIEILYKNDLIDIKK